MSTEFLSKNPAETAAFAKKLAGKGGFKKGSVIGLFGDIGCGKTTFVRGFVSFYELDELVTSPTFTIINEYAGGSVRILHADLYRLRMPDEVRDLGLEDQIAHSDIAFIEWPDNAGGLPFPCDVRIDFSMTEEENKRRIVIQ